MPNPTAAMLVIGDEILSGRTRDVNAHHLAGRLAGHGVDLREVRMIPDIAATITDAARDLAGAHDHLFTSGGIGPTHDDITADAIAAVFDAPIDVRDDARAVLAAHYASRGTEMNAARLRMARIPEGARLIDNPVSAAPGFSLRNIHVMAGVPQIFAAMLEALLPRIAGGAAQGTRTLVIDRGEGDIAAALREIAERFPDVSIGSYPGWSGSGYRVAVVIRGAEAEACDAAAEALREAFPEARE